jgi:hypothetical protein
LQDTKMYDTNRSSRKVKVPKSAFCTIIISITPMAFIKLPSLPPNMLLSTANTVVSKIVRKYISDKSIWI